MAETPEQLAVSIERILKREQEVKDRHKRKGNGESSSNHQGYDKRPRLGGNNTGNGGNGQQGGRNNNNQSNNHRGQGQQNQQGSCNRPCRKCDKSHPGRNCNGDFLTCFECGELLFLSPPYCECSTAQSWQSPLLGNYKVNSDAAVFDDRSIGLGGVMRDSVGDPMAATCVLMQGNDNVGVAEALAARHAISIAVEAGLLRIELETDNLKLFKYLDKGTKEASTFRLIVSDILDLSKYCKFIKFSHISRKGNKVAHCLACLSRLFGELRVWTEEVPQETLCFVLSDSSTFA
uniref:RNase H type-1 domain-containing protein n=1 Tax=Chenopodium quinoa TaxID=63459 RepID=A0A803LVY1_CHEQI